MKNLLWASVLLLLAVALPVVAWIDYSDTATFRAGAAEGTLLVRAQTESKVTRSSRRKYYYDASIEDVGVRIVTGSALKAGERYPVIFSPAALQRYSVQTSGPFLAYRLGRKSDSTWTYFVGDLGIAYLCVLVALEFVFAIGAWRLFAAQRKENV